MHDLHQEFGWLIQVHLGFFKKKLGVFLSILSFNIKLIRDLDF
jgi:hypothetical protein